MIDFTSYYLYMILLKVYFLSGTDEDRHRLEFFFSLKCNYVYKKWSIISVMWCTVKIRYKYTSSFKNQLFSKIVLVENTANKTKPQGCIFISYFYCTYRILTSIKTVYLYNLFKKYLRRIYRNWCCSLISIGSKLMLRRVCITTLKIPPVECIRRIVCSYGFVRALYMYRVREVDIHHHQLLRFCMFYFK